VQLVEEFMGVLEKQHSLIEQLSNNKTGSNSLVDKNIIKSQNSTFDSEVSNSRLNSREKSRVKDASSIFISKFFEEQKRQVKDTAQKTLVSKISKPVKPTVQGKDSTTTSGGGGWLDKLLGMLGLGALTKFLKPGALKALFKKGLTKLSGLFKRVISSIWKGIKTLFSKMWGGLRGLFSGIKNSKFVKGIKNIISKAWNGIKGVFNSVKNKISGLFKSIGKSIRSMWGGIKNSKVFKSLTGIISKVSVAISTFFKGIKDKILSVSKKAVAGIKSIIPEGVKNVAGKVVGGAKNVAGKVVGGAKNLSSAALSKAKGAVSSIAKGAIKNTGGMFKMMGRLTAKGAARVPIIGPAIESVLATMDINAMKKRGLTESELQKQAGKRVITGVTGMIGATGGALLAGTLGSIIPGAGTAIGAILGAIGGDMAGRFLGGLISDYIIPQKYVKTIGAFVTGTTPPKEEMQDFIIKDGKLHKFNRRDEVMGIKTGGAINEFLTSGGYPQQAMKVLITTNKLANEYLRTIANNTAMMVKNLNGGSSGGSSINISVPQVKSPSKQMMTIPNNRDGYASSPYAIG
jgi:hypothetical protein